MAWTMILNSVSLLFFKLIFEVVIMTERLIPCKHFLSMKLIMKNYSKKIKYQMFSCIRTVSLLILKYITDITTSTHYNVLKICAVLARIILNPDDQILLMSNYRESETSFGSLEEERNISYPESSFGPLEEETNISYPESSCPDLEKCLCSQYHDLFQKADIVVRNLKKGRSIIMEFSKEEINPDEQNSEYFTDSNSQYTEKYSRSSQMFTFNESSYTSSDKDISTDLEGIESKTGEFVRSPTPSEDVLNRTLKYPNLYPNLKFKNGNFSTLSEKTSSQIFVDGEEYSLEQDMGVIDSLDPSNYCSLVKQISIDSEKENSGNDTSKFIFTDKNFKRNKSNSPEKRDRKQNLSKSALELLRKHKLISEVSSSSDDLSNENGSCNSIDETRSTSSVDKSEINNKGYSESLRVKSGCIPGSHPNEYRPQNSSDLAFNTNPISYTESVVKNGYDFENKSESSSTQRQIQKNEPTSSLTYDESLPQSKNVLEKPSDKEPFSVKVIYSVKLNVKNGHRGSLDDINLLKCDSVKLSNNASKLSNENLVTSTNENDYVKETSTPTKYSKSPKNIEKELNKNSSPKEKFINGFAENNDIPNIEVNVTDLRPFGTKTSNAIPRGSETGGITSLTNNKTGTQVIEKEHHINLSPKEKFINSFVENSDILNMGVNVTDLKPLETKTSNANTKGSKTGGITSPTYNVTANHVLPTSEHQNEFKLETLNDSILCDHANKMPLNNSENFVFKGKLKNKFGIVDPISLNQSVKLLRILQSLYPEQEFDLSREKACKNDTKRNELIKIFYKNKINEINNKVFRMLETFEELELMTIEQYDEEMKQIFQIPNQTQNEENSMFKCANQYLLGQS